VYHPLFFNAKKDVESLTPKKWLVNNVKLEWEHEARGNSRIIAAIVFTIVVCVRNVEFTIYSSYNIFAVHNKTTMENPDKWKE